MAFTQDFRTQRRNYNDGETRIGEKDRLWYDSNTNTIRISDGVTPGGTVVGGGSSGGSYTLPTASSTVKGGVKIGSNITITDGVISVAAPFSGNYNDLSNKPTGYATLTGEETLTNKTLTSPTITDGVFQTSFTIGNQVFYEHGYNGFSVNENWDIVGQSNFTGYHYTSGAGRDGVAFTLARTGQFTDGFGIHGTASGNEFVIGSETANTDYVFKTSIGMPFDVSGGTTIFKIGRDGNLTFADSTVQTTAWLGSTDTIIKVAGSFASNQPFKSQVVADLTDGVSISTWMGIPQFSTNKTWKFDYNGTLTMPGITKLSTGSVSAPSLTFTNATNRGIYDSNDGGVGFVGAGWEQARIGIATNTNRYVILQGGQAGVTSPAIGTGGGAEALTIFSNGNSIRFYTKGYGSAPQMTIAALDNTVNYVQVQGNLTGSSPTISSVGSDSTVDLALVAKAGAIVVKNPNTQNLIGYSNTFSNGNWSKGTFVTVATTAATTDPFGGSNAWLLLADTSTNSHALYYIGSSPWVLNAINTLSIYVKTAGYTLVQMSDIGTAAYCARFNLTAVTATPVVGCTATITLVTNGWYRLTVTTTTSTAFNSSSRFAIIGYPSSGATPNTYNVSYTGDATNGIYIYGAQVELAPTAGTYVETVSLTQIYTAPKISFNGVTNIQLASTGALSLTPAGNGALQAQPGDGTTLNGNARGAYAVDWQMHRYGSQSVASGGYTVIGGGDGNTNTGYAGTIAGGVNNSVGYNWGFVGGGSQNTSSGQNSSLAGGLNNTANGYYASILGGAYNNAGVNTTVTTQTTTATGVTAGVATVTLSSANASIKVGQFITSSSGAIPSYVYVAAISSTTLTLSVNAQSTIGSAITLNFYSPTMTVAGGSYNTASGAFSFVGGGGAIFSSNGNTASGDWSFVGGGYKNTASGAGSFVGGGGFYTGNFTSGNTASGDASTIVGGMNQTAPGFAAFIGGGQNNYANGTLSSVLGGGYGLTRTVVGNTIFPASNSPFGTYTGGQSQAGLLILARQTTDNTATILASDSNTPGTTNQLALPVNSAFFVKGSVVAGVTAGGNSKAWTFECVIKKGAANSATLVGTPIVNVVAQDSGASAWTIAITSGTDTLTVTVTGQASTTIRWVCKIETTEMTF
jgi:hypothetical protein